ncbi:MAG: CRISPR-associated protein Cas5 [Candidatus Pacearchaeota archaeon]
MNRENENGEILFLKLFQPFTQFRNPFTFFYAQTFPLPPKSTILGFLENATDKYYSGCFDDLKISIWGYYSSIYWNYLHFIKGNPYLDENRILKGGDKKPLYGLNKSQRTPTYQQEIAGGNFYIFLKGEKKKIEELYKSFNPVNKVLNLGRGEDVVFIRDVKILNDHLDNKDLKDYHISIGTYILTNIETNQSVLINESIISTLPVYSITLNQKFVYRENGQFISSRDEIFNKNKIERKVNFKSVYYIENRKIILKNTLKTFIFKFDNIKFYLNELSWL